MPPRQSAVIALLGTAQTLAWASSYYLPAILAAPIAQDLALAPNTIFAIFSAALLLTALLGPLAGRTIDRQGGRPVLIATSLAFAAGLALLAAAQGLASLILAWAVLGAAMGFGLYDAAFATLAGLYGRAARSPITGITLIAGFASTVGWPLSALFLDAFGWRGACLAWAALHLALGLPLNLLLPGSRNASTTRAAEPEAPTPPRRDMLLLAFLFATVGFTSTAIAAHLPGLLEAAGTSTTAAVAAGALIGPAQVAARLAEFGLMRNLHPLWMARLATALHPLAAGTLLLLGAPAAAAFALLHGAGNGLLTIARGTLPLALFGPTGYGRRQGWLVAPARLAQAGAPLGFGLLLGWFGVGAVWVTGALGLLALGGLFMLHARQQQGAPPPAPPAGN